MSDNYLIRYKCPDCGEKWEDLYSCACDAQCPKCGIKNISPMMWKPAGLAWTEKQTARWELDLDSIVERTTISLSARELAAIIRKMHARVDTDIQRLLNASELLADMTSTQLKTGATQPGVDGLRFLIDEIIKHYC